MEPKEEKTTTVEVKIDEELAIFASQYSEITGQSTEELLSKILRRGLKETRKRMRQLLFAGMDNMLQAREDIITQAEAKIVEERKKH